MDRYCKGRVGINVLLGGGGGGKEFLWSMACVGGVGIYIYSIEAEEWWGTDLGCVCLCLYVYVCMYVCM